MAQITGVVELVKKDIKVCGSGSDMAFDAHCVDAISTDYALNIDQWTIICHGDIGHSDEIFLPSLAWSWNNYTIIKLK